MSPVDERAHPSRVRPMQQTTRFVRSAGGVLIRQEADDSISVLLGRRRRSWRLPKGKLESGESDAEAAVREIGEETGRRGRILAYLDEHDFSYIEDGVHVEKTAVHFLLLDEGEARQPDGEFEQLAWFPITAARRRLRFPAERSSVARASRLIATDPSLLDAPRPSVVRSLLRRLIGR